jgi:hypothetical protein
MTTGVLSFLLSAFIQATQPIGIFQKPQKRLGSDSGGYVLYLPKTFFKVP